VIVDETDGVADELTKLADLHDRGALSEAEFKQQKSRLLRRRPLRGKRPVVTIVVLGAVVVVVAGFALGVSSGSSSPPPKVAFETTALTESQIQVAINYMNGQVGHSTWNGKCLGLVTQAYAVAGVDIGSSDDPITYWAANPRGYTEHSAPYGPYGNPPAGAIMFWGATQWSSDGHAGISLGNATVVSSAAYPYADGPTEGQVFSLSQRSASTYHYLGYIIPGDLESSPPPTVAAPAPTTPTTHPLSVSSGSGSPIGSSSLQPAAGSSTLQPAAGTGALQGGGSVTPPTASSPHPASSPSSSSAAGGGSSSHPTTTTPPPPTTYPEAIGDGPIETTYTSPNGPSGPTGERLSANTVVQVVCQEQGTPEGPSGVKWWFQLQNGSWFSADAACDEGATLCPGGFAGTPDYDSSVPVC
jgi:Short C-terminal domain